MTDLAPDRPPVACSLGAGDFQARIAWIAALNGGALRGHHREDLVLHLTYAPSAADAVRDMVAREQSCCAFLAFVMGEDADGVQLTITAPEEAREAAELIFEPFVAKTAKGASSCGCCGGAAA